MVFSEPVGEAQSARLNLGMGVGRGSLMASGNADSLIDADLRYIGTVDYEVQPGDETVINLSHSGQDVSAGFNFFGWTLGVDERDLHWNDSLAPDIPFNITINGGVGEQTIDLSGVQITSFTLNTGVGEAQITLPAIDNRVPVRLSGGVGKTVLNVPEGTLITADIDGGVGETVIDLPDNAAVRIDANGGLSRFDFPPSWTRVSGDDSNGVWESPAYATASIDERIEIEYDGGIGTLRVH
jgi:hypothetical protein